MDGHDEHYIASVTALGDSHEVVASQAVFTRNGIKLIDKGTRVNSALHEKLVRHKLLPPIDECLTVSDCVTNASLRERAKAMIDSEPRFQTTLRAALPNTRRLLDAFRAMPLNSALAFKLTVAREQRPEIFEHSVQVALIALSIAIKSRLPDSELPSLAAAGMLHDIGELHVDPQLLDPGRRLAAAELHHVYAHPITASLILREYPQFHPVIGAAVFEHHERIDGSGYPRGLKGDEIGPAGKILMLAEAVTTIFARSWPTHGASRLSVMLKMSRRKFDQQLSDQLAGLLQGGEPQDAGSLGEATAADVVAQVGQLAEVFKLWHGARQACAVGTPQAAESPLVGFVERRLVSLERTLLETGFHPDEVAVLTAGIENDPVALAEMQLLARESRWQIGDIANEVRRRWNELPSDDAGHALVSGWLERTERLLRE